LLLTKKSELVFIAYVEVSLSVLFEHLNYFFQVEVSLFLLNAFGEIEILLFFALVHDSIDLRAVQCFLSLQRLIRLLVQVVLLLLSLQIGNLPFLLLALLLLLRKFPYFLRFAFFLAAGLLLGGRFRKFMSRRLFMNTLLFRGKGTHLGSVFGKRRGTQLRFHIRLSFFL